MTVAVERLSKLFDVKQAGNTGRHMYAVRDVSLSIEPGEIVGLVGESGSGKSTLARLVLGLLKPTSGEVYFNGQATSKFRACDWSEYRHRVQVVFQDPRSSLNWRMSIEEIVTEPLKNYRLGDRKLRRETAERLLELVNLNPQLLGRRPPDVSGGQLQRVAIARALALEPSYLVCDEPLSALDVSVQAGVVNLLLSLQESRRLGMLFISHDLGVVRHVSDRVLVMYSGEIVESATAEDFYGHPEHPYSRALLGFPEAEIDTIPKE